MNIITFIILFQSITCDYDNRIITTLKYSAYRVQTTIVNGTPATKGQMPYLVSFKEPIRGIDGNTRLWKNLCGGSIIGTNKVLTAAHCFENQGFYYRFHPNILRIVAGSLRNDLVHSGETETNVLAQWRRIKTVIIHNDYHFPQNDIAVVYTDVPWQYNDDVDFIVPATEDSDYPTTCMTAGFGKIGHKMRDGISPVLLRARIKVLSRWRCDALWGMNMNTFICTDSLLNDVAQGDSGGPLACQNTADPYEQPDREILVGVVSGKNFDKTTLYTRVSAYHDWIETDGANKLYSIIHFSIILLILIYLLFSLKRQRNTGMVSFEAN